MTDAELLQTYVQDASSEAFTALVERYLDLVYSVARRHVGSAALAEEVAQSVFIELSRHARRIKPGTPLVAWLHVVSRRKALNAIRDAARHQARERAAVELVRDELLESAMKSDPGNWSAVAPLLDEAVESLGHTDRTAILLRYFQDKNLRDVGEALGVSDDAAQKRVSRALEQLRAFLLRRGVTVTAAGLATDLSAHAITAAPATLGVSIVTSVAASGAALSTAVAASRILAMTTLKKSTIVAAFAFAGAAGLYEAKLIGSQSAELQALRRDNERTTVAVRALRRARDESGSRLKNVEQQIDARLAAARAISPADAALEPQMQEWFDQIDRMKLLLLRHPELNIPELQFVSDKQWFDVAASGRLDSEKALRKAMAQLRQIGEGRAQERIFKGLKAYIAAHDGMLPNTPQEIVPYCDPPLDPAILNRYEMLRTGKAADGSSARKGPDGMIMAPKTPADVENDTYLWITLNSYATNSGNALSFDIRQAQMKFRRANNGLQATSALQLAPYLKWSEDPALVQSRLDTGMR